MRCGAGPPRPPLDALRLQAIDEAKVVSYMAQVREDSTLKNGPGARGGAGGPAPSDRAGAPAARLELPGVAKAVARTAASVGTSAPRARRNGSRSRRIR